MRLACFSAGPATCSVSPACLFSFTRTRTRLTRARWHAPFACDALSLSNTAPYSNSVFILFQALVHTRPLNTNRLISGGFENEIENGLASASHTVWRVAAPPIVQLVIYVCTSEINLQMIVFLWFFSLSLSAHFYFGAMFGLSLFLITTATPNRTR